MTRKTLEKLRGILLGALSGLLLGGAFPPVGFPILSAIIPEDGFPPLAWVALVPLFVQIRASRGRRPGLPFLAFGVAFFTVGLYWIEPVLTPLGPFLLSFVLTFLFVWPTGHLGASLMRKGVSLLVAAPVLFLVNEWLRTWLLTGFPWLLIAYTQADYRILAQSADVLGTYGILFLVVLANAAIAEAPFRFREGRPRAALAPILLVLVLVGGFSLYGAIRPGSIVERPGPKVLLVQGNVPQYMKTQALRLGKEKPVHRSRFILDTHLALTREGLARHPDTEVVIWPETMFSYPMTEEDGPRAAGRRHAALTAFRILSKATGGRPAIVGALCRTKDGEQRNSVYLVTGDGRPSTRYDKLHAVPGGEYIPLRTVAPEPLVRWVSGIVRENAGFVPDLVEGEKAVLIDAGGTRYGPLICYEIIYPGLVRDLREMGADVMLNITNYGWFPETNQPLQANQMALFRALEARRPVVVAANTGVSAVISAKGEMTELRVDGERKDVAGVLFATVPLCRSRSVKAAIGELPGLLATLLALFLLVRTRMGRGIGTSRRLSS
jgi:apolipoprotein N-acyltransferase